MKEAGCLTASWRRSLGRRRRMAGRGGSLTASRARHADAAIGSGKVNERSALADRARDGRVVPFGRNLEVWSREVGLNLAVPGARLDPETARRRDAEFNSAPFQDHPDVMREWRIGREAHVSVGIGDIHVVLEALEADVLVLRGHDKGPFDPIRIEGVHLHVHPAGEVLYVQGGARGIKTQRLRDVLKLYGSAKVPVDGDG